MQSYRNSEARPPIMQGSPPKLALPKLDWDRPPWNRWAFQHVREFLPTVEVWRGHGHRRRLDRADVDFDGLAVADSEGRPTTLAGLLDETYTDGFLVLKNGRVAYERYFNGMDERSLHLSQSMAKSVTGSVFGILVGRGLIDPARLVTDYLPELAETALAGATVQHVLDMTTGVRFSEEYTDRYSEIGQVDVASGWKPIPPGSDPDFQWPSHLFELILRLKDNVREHGEAFEYRSIETDVLAFIMERVSGKRLAQLISEELWQKLGADESACFTVDSAGYALADGGFNATLRDYGRFGQLILDNGGGVIPAEWIEATRSGRHGPDFNPSLPEGSYRNQFWIEDRHSRALMCRGVFGQLIHIDWENRMVVVKLSTYPDFTNIDYSVATLKAVHAIAAALT
ncbi:MULTISPECIES: serine hydrolase [unclassified Mesorhizobium]|uniref:serine hydrolase domain-containing protein n=1 Tax=unclassified Mesorhizobium TaxID=325217 RepID=UPI000FCC811F|nr:MULTISPECIES: serine hydrolase [unclassified Mesorhizobium]TGP23836.1 class C beta-lactamase-related serine hydrolase [Mesorhizobium sp. M1D.F.Ca.ET.231.01.1.1]TGP33980.1 class C beta-lactamase-related serine hydrolase [Mesorhizobium sp. M1D.F.Ca.ET.234.01.1.1]TGS47345.1 class C beta-lactamase-related serine hydrolase [Mesorhizobium sp. M1D.F.Ca.ET.184.01.1.1]TGS62605.1 class C beta-lactamase-related serine hydrolase [Mesorhizobium sp. M1D.F.Ca.ET.183.01.1.1]